MPTMIDDELDPRKASLTDEEKIALRKWVDLLDEPQRSKVLSLIDRAFGKS